MKRKQTLYGSFILLESLIWGLGNPIIKNTASMIPTFTGIAMRFFLALFLFLLFFGRRIWKNRKVFCMPCLVVCFFTATSFTLGNFALRLTKATTAGFLMGIAVIFTPFLERLFLKKPIHWKILPLVAVVCIGMYLLCCGNGEFSFGLGELVAVFCSFSFALMLTFSEKYIENLDIDPIALSAMQCSFSGVFALVLALIFDGVYDFSRLNAFGIFSVAYLGICSTFMACILQNKAMRHIPATLASLAFSVEPVFTALFSYFMLGETLSGLGFLGGAIVIVGVMGASIQHQ